MFVLFQFRRVKMPKKITLLALISLIFLSIAAYLAGKASRVQAAPVPDLRIQPPAEPRTITVVGEGVVNLKPDLATINVGAEARASTVAEAKAEVETYMSEISEKLDWMGIDENDIQASQYVIRYEQEPMSMVSQDSSAAIREAYYVSNMIRVTIRHVEKAGDVLDSVVQAGANQVYGVSYTVADRSAWQSLAQAQAMVNAKMRAQELANLAEVELGEVLSISEIVGGMPVPVGEHGMRGGGIVPGELEFSTQLQVTFAIR
jgi:uncharacterized protein YggE